MDPQSPTAGKDEGGDLSALKASLVASALALLLPGLGHFYLGRRVRAAIFFGLVIVAAGVGVMLHGNLYTPVAGRPLTLLATVGAMGMGSPYFLLRFIFGYSGDVTAPGYDYGTAFLLSAGLMNLLLVLDTWDISSGKKE